MSTPDVHAWADQLRQYATHFCEPSDDGPERWRYERDLNGMKHIRYAGDWTGYDNPARRLQRTVRQLWRTFVHRPKGPEAWFYQERSWLTLKSIISVWMSTPSHLPDGVIMGGSIITQWEENGEYLQYVQPVIGALLADWMDAEPESAHAQAIAQEMKRINDDYARRVREAEEAPPVPRERDGGED